MLSYLTEHWRGLLVWAIIAVLCRLYYMRSDKYKRKKYEKRRGVYDAAARSLATGIRMWYPVVYFILADLYRELPEDGPEKLLRLDLGLSKMLSGALDLTTTRIIGWVIVALFAIAALISLIIGLVDFLPHINNLDLLLAYTVPFLFWSTEYTRLLFNFGGARFDPEGYDLDSLLYLLPMTCKLVVPLLFAFVLYLFYRQLKDRYAAKIGMSRWDYDQIVQRERDEQAAKERRREEILSRPAGDYGGSSFRTIQDMDYLDLETPDPRDSGKATMQDMPSVIRDSAGRTYHRTSYGGSPATYTCDDDYSTIAIYNVYQSESYWMNTNAGSFEIVSW